RGTGTDAAGPRADGQWWPPGWRGSQWPGRAVRWSLHRVRDAQRQADPGVRADRHHRPRLERGEEWPHRRGFGAAAAERLAVAVAAGDAGADEPQLGASGTAALRRERE